MNRRTAISLAAAALTEAACTQPSAVKGPEPCTRPTKFCWSTALPQVQAQTQALVLLILNANYRADFLADDPANPMQGKSAGHQFKKVDKRVYVNLLKYFKNNAQAQADLKTVSGYLTTWSNQALGPLGVTGATYDNPEECPCNGNYDPNNPYCEVVDPLLLG